MLSHKTVWRCGNKALLSLFLAPTYLFSVGPDTSASAKVYDRDKEEDTARAKCSDSTDRRWSEKEFLPQYSEKEIAIQECILKTQGEEVNKLHIILARPDRVNRAVLFYGESGTGKTQGVNGLCRRMAFRVERIDRHQFTSGSYGEGGKKLVKRLNTIVKTMKCRGIFIDECDKIFDHPEQPNRDTAQTSNDVWVWLDDFNKLKRADMILFLACNDIKHFPQPLLNRLAGMMFKFHGPTTPKDKTDALAAYFPMYPNIPLHFQQKGKWLFTKYSRFTGRDLQLIYQKACDYAGDNEVMIDHIERAMEKIHQERVDCEYYKEEETPQRQSERHFQWNRALQGTGTFFTVVGFGIKVGRGIYKLYKGDVAGAVEETLSVSDTGESVIDTLSTTLS